jgi:hypothetical protein
LIRGDEVISSAARDLQSVNYRFLASLGMTIAFLVSPPIAPARAQSRLDSTWALDSRVVQVVSGGLWKDGDRSGQYRIIVRSDGADSSTHYSAVVQWMARRDDIGQDLELVTSVPLSTVAPKWHNLLDPELNIRRGRWVLTMDASTGPMKPAIHHASFTLGPPGHVTRR